MGNKIREQGNVVKYQEECEEGKNPEKKTVPTQGNHMSIQVGVVRILGKEEGGGAHSEGEDRVYWKK